MDQGDNEPSPRMSAYAFFVLTCKEENEKKHPDKSVLTEFSKGCADRWKTMSDEEKQSFYQMAEKDKKRYESEMANYCPKGKQTTERKKRTIDPNVPKRSPCFWKDECPKVKETLPDSTFADVTEELVRRWNEASAETKSKYEALAAKDQARYVKEMEAYKGGISPVEKAKPAAKVGKSKDDSEEEAKTKEEEDNEAEAK